MSMLTTPLWREWDLLQREVMPSLLEVEEGHRPPRVWSVGSLADAVAVTVAFRHASRGDRSGSPMQAYASDPTPGDLSPVGFKLSEIRCVPAASRSASFHRQDYKWIPDHAIAEQIVLSQPSDPVDLVTVRAEDALTPHRAGLVLEQLREGGRVLLIDGPLFAIDDRHLQPIGAGGRLFRKCSKSRRPSPGPGDPVEDGGETLAQRQRQADLVARHLRLARSLARRFAHHGEAKEDLEQVALLALVKAAKRFDPDREASFSTYATASILGEIKRHFRDKTWMLRVPRSVQERYLSIKDTRELLTHELGAAPTVDQIATHLGLSRQVVVEAMEAGENYWPESLDVGVFDGEPTREIPVIDPHFDRALDRHQLHGLLPSLDCRERLILKRLYLDGWTQRRVAEEIGVSQMQISRLLVRTIENLRSQLDD
jgi:RNA polymerase sigma-B factor